MSASRCNCQISLHAAVDLMWYQNSESWTEISVCGEDTTRQFCIWTLRSSCFMLCLVDCRVTMFRQTPIPTRSYPRPRQRTDTLTMHNAQARIGSMKRRAAKRVTRYSDTRIYLAPVGKLQRLGQQRDDNDSRYKSMLEKWEVEIPPCIPSKTFLFKPTKEKDQ